MSVIPPSQAARIAQIRDIQWEALDDALDVLDDKIAQRARMAMEKIRASNYSPGVIRSQARLVAAHTNSATARALAQQIIAAATYAQRAADVARAWEISGRLREGVEHLSVSDSAMARAMRPGVSAIDAEASLARVKTSTLRTPQDVRRALDELGARTARGGYTGPSTSGTRVVDRLRQAGLMRKSREIGLSKRLHNSAALNVQKTERAIGTAIREASNINKAGRDLINVLNQAETPLSASRKLTKPLQRLQDAGRKLQRLSVDQGDPDALKAATKEFNSSFGKIKKIAATRVDSRGGYIELKQIIEKRGVEGLDKALDRWLDEKQAYHAERIVETETAGAYRAREIEQHSGKSYVTGAYWRRSPGMVSLDKRRKRDIAQSRRGLRAGKKNAKRKTKGRPCTVCPSLADQWFPVEFLRDYPRGAHPHCRCWFEWTYSKGGLSSTPLTQADLDWFNSLPD